MASSRNYRPRPIDVRKLMPIMRDLHLPPVPRAEEMGVEGDDRRGGSAGSYGMSSEDAEEKNFVKAFQAAVQAALEGKTGSSVSDIPIPGIGLDKEYAGHFKGKKFAQPPSFIRNFGQTTDKGADADFDALTQYELDVEDEEWLQKLNDARKAKPLKLEQMEDCIDRFEKEIATYDKLPLHRAERIAAQAAGFRGAVVKAIFEYWENKRKKNNMPLLRKYQLPPDQNDSDPSKTFRPREKEISIRRRLRKQQNDTDAFEKLHTIQQEFGLARQLVDMAVQREKVKLDWLKSRFDLIQAELERNPTLYYVIHGRPYVPPRVVINKRKRGGAGGANAGGFGALPGVPGGAVSPRSAYEQQQQQLKKRKLMRRIAMPDKFHLQFKRGLELGPANNLREQLALFTLAPPRLANRAALSRARIGRGGRLIFDRQPFGPRYPQELRDPNLSMPHGLSREDREYLPPWHGLPYGLGEGSPPQQVRQQQAAAAAAAQQQMQHGGQQQMSQQQYQQMQQQQQRKTNVSFRVGGGNRYLLLATTLLAPCSVSIVSLVSNLLLVPDAAPAQPKEVPPGTTSSSSNSISSNSISSNSNSSSASR